MVKSVLSLGLMLVTMAASFAQPGPLPEIVRLTLSHLMQISNGWNSSPAIFW